MLPLKDNVPSRSFPVINWTLIGLNVVVFMAELSAYAHGQLEGLIEDLAVIPARFLQHPDAHELSTLITSMFLHGGWFHLLSNMWALYIFGDGVEDRLGPARYLVFYLLCGLAAGMTHICFNRNATVPSLGASGAIAGVLAAYLVFYPWARIITLIPILFVPFFLELPAPVFIGIWFLSQLLNGTLEIAHNVYSSGAPSPGGVAWWAHVGGFVAGAVLAWPFAASRARPRKRYADEQYPW
jgi:membrane associated rhomboid family serine protease